MKQDLLLKKLAFQAESFQSGFEALTRSRNFNEMIRNFEHLLRSNILTSKIKILKRDSIKDQWQIIGLQSDYDKSELSLLDPHSKLTIKYLKDEAINCSIVLPLVDRSQLGILIGSKLDGNRLNEFDKITLQILLQVFDSAYKNFINQKKEKNLIFELNEKIVQLNSLIDTGIELSRFNKRSILYNLAIERATSLTNASSALLLVTNKKENTILDSFTFPPGKDYNKILNSKFKTEFIFEHNDKIFQFVLSEKETRKGVTSFNELDKMLLQSICRQTQVSIENEYLYRQSLEKERIEKEMTLAAAIQQSIIPEKLPEISGYDLSGINIPSREVGGDYYDIIDLGNGKYALIIADVAGKGIAAALLVNTLHAALYSYLQFNLPLTDLVDNLNKLIFISSPSDKFITFFIAVLESGSGSMDIVNAGHNPILILRENGEIEQITAGGIGLGMFDFGLPYSGENIILNSGDRVFLYTDGIPEAMNQENLEYSDEKMIKFLKNNSNLEANKFVQNFVADIKAFIQNAPQSDDITMLLLKKN